MRKTPQLANDLKVLLTREAAEDLQVLPEAIHTVILNFLDYSVPEELKPGPQIGVPRRLRPRGPARMGGYGIEYHVHRKQVIVEKIGRFDAFKHVVYSARTTTPAGKIWIDPPFKSSRNLPKLRREDDDPPALPPADRNGNFPAVAYARAMLARKLMDRRRCVGLLQNELAMRARIPAETLHRIERAKLTARATTISKVIRAVETAEDELRSQGTIKGSAVDRAAFAKELADRRQRLGISELDLARRAGLVPLTIQLIENGMRIPHVGTVEKIVRALDEIAGSGNHQPPPR